MTYKMTIHDILTNDIIFRDFTQTESAQYEIYAAASAASEAFMQTQAAARNAAQAKLLALGLTFEDLNSLGL